MGRSMTASTVALSPAVFPTRLCVSVRSFLEVKTLARVLKRILFYFLAFLKLRTTKLRKSKSVRAYLCVCVRVFVCLFIGSNLC